MSTADNERLVVRYIAEVWDAHDPEAVDRFLAPGYRRHLSPTLPPLDRAGQVERLAGFQAAFPDVTVTVEDVVAGGDRVAFRSTMRGTHEGELLGVPPTGRTVEVGLIDIIRVEDGRFVEHWGGPDVFDLLRQLGASVSLPGNHR